MLLSFNLPKWQYYRCSYLLIFAMQSQWILTCTSFPIWFLSLYCPTWLLHTQVKTNTVSLNSFFWAIPRLWNLFCQHFGTPCLFLRPAYTVYENGKDSVPKLQQIQFRRWEITQKKEYNVQNTAKVSNQGTLSTSSPPPSICTPQK